MVRTVVANDVKYDYNFLTTLGEGRYGEVRRAIHNITSIPRAIKVIRKNTTSTKKENALMMKEVEFLREIDHPNAVGVIEYYDDPYGLHIVFELLKGGNLHDKWSRGAKYSELRVAEIMKELLSTVNYMHNKGIVHRDIKMENILFVTEDSKSIIKLCDFGAAIKFDPSKKLTENKGKLLYTAPEVLKGEYNEKCDIWSCAVILFMLIAGRPPFDGFDREQLKKHIERVEYSMKGKGFEKVSEEVKDLIQNMLQADTTKRYSAQQCLDHPWFQKMFTEEEIAKDIDPGVMENVATFTSMSKLRTAFWTFLITYFSPHEDIIKIIDTWNALDRRGRGVLSKEELNKGFEIAFKKERKVTIDSIFNSLDINKCGSVEFTGFLIAAFDKSSFLNDTKIHQMFRLFDKNEDELISVEEFKEFLTPNKGFKDYVEHGELIRDVGLEFKDTVTYEAFRSTVLKHFEYRITP